MEQSQVETFLHEFGHLVHYHFRYHQPWQGISQPERDFMEAPSMMLEEWIYDTETLQRFAVNDAGEPIRSELVAKMRAARAFGQGLMVHRQLRLAALSLEIYDRDPAGLDIAALDRHLLEAHSVVPYPDGTHEFASFPHLNGYSAFYYTYMWSQAIAYDMLTRFEASGLRHRATAIAYRRTVLEPGGSIPAAEAVQNFLGRPFNFAAFEQRLASDQ
jgi:thimet oligopeptidase